MDFNQIANQNFQEDDDGVKFRAGLFTRPSEEGLTLPDISDGWIDLETRSAHISFYHSYAFDFVPRKGDLPVEEGNHVLKVEQGNKSVRVVEIPEEVTEETDGEKVPEEIARVFEEN